MAKARATSKAACVHLESRPNKSIALPDVATATATLAPKAR